MVEHKVYIPGNYFSIEAKDDTAYLVDRFGAAIIKVESSYKREYPGQIAQSVCISEISYIAVRAVNEGFFREIEEKDVLLLVAKAVDEVEVLKSKEAYDKYMRKENLIKIVVKKIQARLDADLENAIYGALYESNNKLF